MDPISTAVNTGLGLLLEGHNDRRQLRQQGKLGEQQLGLNQRQMKYGKELDLQMWKDTNYPAQVEQLKAAGLNPGLLYGKGGAGGTTTGGSAGGVGMANAPQGGSEIMGLQLMGAQKALIEAQTAKTQAETAKTSGVDTELAKENIRIQRNAADFATNAYEVNYSKLMAEADRAGAEAQSAMQNAEVGAATIDERIATAEGELIGLGIANELKRKQADLTEEQIKATAEQVKQKWTEIGVSKDRLKLDQFVKDISDSTKLAVEVASKITSEVIEAVGRGRGATRIPKTSTRNERGWSEKAGEYWKTIEQQ